MRLDLHARRVLVVTAHPDDAEFFAGGFLLRMAEDGAEVHLVLLTDGQGGSMDLDIDRPTLASLRRREQRRAAEILGLASVTFVGEDDGRLFDSHPLRITVARRIREVRPEVLVTTDPEHYFVGHWIQHPDHRAAGAIALAAAMPFANVRHAAPELDHLEPHTISHVLLGATSDAPHHLELEERHVDKKIAALLAHESQMKHWDIADVVRRRAEEHGRAAGVRFAESFVHHRLR